MAEKFLSVLNPGGRDEYQDFAAGAGKPGEGPHPPVNYHAYAACCRGAFCRKENEIPEGTRNVLVLLRKKALPEALAAVRSLKRKGMQTMISWKESGLHQVSEALADARRYVTFREICHEADAFLSSTPELVTLYRESGCLGGDFFPTPYPVDVPDWDFSVPLSERKGIFIGTREFDVPSRNHLLAVSTAAALGVPVTVVNSEGKSGERLLQAIHEGIEISERLAYPEYLRLMARHRIVLQLDRSAVPGQVAGDALLCGSVCVGGDGAIERMVFPGLNAHAHTTGELAAIARRLLEDDDFYETQAALAQELACKEVSFAAVEDRLKRLFPSIPSEK